MALVTCPECAADVSSTAPTCPKCGYVFPVKEGPLILDIIRVLSVILGTVLAFVVVFVLLGKCGTSVVIFR